MQVDWDMPGQITTKYLYLKTAFDFQDTKEAYAMSQEFVRNFGVYLFAIESKPDSRRFLHDHLMKMYAAWENKDTPSFIAFGDKLAATIRPK